MGKDFCDKEKKERLPRKKIKHLPKRAKTRRLRTRGDLSPTGPLSALFPSALDANCDPLPPQDVAVPTATEYEYIEDTSGLIQNWWNPCDHRKYKGTLSLGAIFYDNGVDTGWANYEGSPSFYQFLCDNVPFPSEQLQDELAAKAEDHFVSPVDANSDSLANFVIELIQSAQGNIKALNKYTKVVTRFWAVVRYWARQYKLKGHSDTASWWLAWNFAIKTTYMDAIRSLCAVHNARKRFDWLQKRNHKPTEVQFRVEKCFDPGDVVLYPEANYLLETYIGHPETCVPGGLSANVPVDTPTWIELRRDEYELTFSATGWVMFDLPDWIFASPSVGVPLTLLQQEGVTNPLKVLWNATPYTWLADWFVSFRTHLQEKLADLGPFENAELIKSGHSWKLTSRWNCFLCQSFPNGYFEKQIGTIAYDRYIRKLDLPSHSVSPFQVPWTGYQGSIVTSLLWQRQFRRR